MAAVLLLLLLLPIGSATVLPIVRSKLAEPRHPVEAIVDLCRQQANDFDTFRVLETVHATDPDLFFQVLLSDLKTFIPAVYTPGIAAACLRFGELSETRPYLTLSLADLTNGQIAKKLGNWSDIDVVVVSDGERILGLGDLGVWGACIPISKLSLYTALGGFKPTTTLPIILDVGTNNKMLRSNPLYDGHRISRDQGLQYDKLIHELIENLSTRSSLPLLQFEDFGRANAFKLLEKYRGLIPTFNDDIQGTGAVVLAGLLSSQQITGKSLGEHKYFFVGAGQANVGVAKMLIYALMRIDKMDEDQARKLCWITDQEGLIHSGRSNLPGYLLEFAHYLPSNLAPLNDPKAFKLAEILTELKATVLIGASGVPNLFTKSVLNTMALNTNAPIIFALSNPTDHAECTAEEAYKHTDGRVLFASGSPFGPVTLTKPDGTTQIKKTGQANNLYIFPGVGIIRLGVKVSKARKVTNEMLFAAAQTVSRLTTNKDLEVGSLYPQIKELRTLAMKIAVAVAQTANSQGLATAEFPSNPKDFLNFVSSIMYFPGTTTCEALF